MHIDNVNRPIIIGEYPYYRASPGSWKSNLTVLKQNGIDIISFYIPWRFHEIKNSDDSYQFDFSGTSSEQKNLHYFLTLISELNLKALIKPGPFIHAEVQLGGIPDRFCKNLEYTYYIGLNQQYCLSQGKKLPSFFDPNFKKEVSIWLNNLSLQIIQPHSDPSGPIIGIQLGNEGIYSDANFHANQTDASFFSIEQYIKCTNSKETILEKKWIHWHANALCMHWTWIDKFYPKHLEKIINLPLQAIKKDNTNFANWLLNINLFQKSNFLIGHTEWIGNASSNRKIFMSYLINIIALKSNSIESNWGFACNDNSFANPKIPCFHALLNLMLGSKTCSIYTACSTITWDESIDLDKHSLIEENISPDLYNPPYCPGAPFTEDHNINPNFKALDLIKDFIYNFGKELIATELKFDATLHFSEEFLIETALSKSDKIFTSIFNILQQLLFEHQIALDIKTNSETDSSTDSSDFTFKNFNDFEKFINYTSALILKKEYIGLTYNSKYKTTAILRRSNPKTDFIIIGMFNPGTQTDYISIATPFSQSDVIINSATVILHIYQGNKLQAVFSNDFSKI